MDLSSKFSLYDVLVMIIPGGIIMTAIALTTNTEWLSETVKIYYGDEIVTEYTTNFLSYALILSFTYIIGLINNWINEGIFRGFRNSDVAIENELKKVLKNNGNINLQNFIGHKYDSGKTDIVCLPHLSIKILWGIICHLLPCRANRSEPIYYYKAYYSLSTNQRLGSIPLIETQVALLRNIILPLSLLALLLTYKNIILIPYQSIISVLVIISIYVVMIQRQNKVYNIVWESANYYNL